MVFVHISSGKLSNFCVMMVVTKKIVEVKKRRNEIDPSAKVGFVPTMGFLHEGHLSLVRKARLDNDQVVTSIFVNPTQFSPDEDLESYPRDLERDLKLLENEGVDVVFAPTDEELYSQSFQTYVTVKEVAVSLEGASRPTHFQGVATIVAKLFNIVMPTRAYFGQKDGQQCLVVKRMVQDLNFDIDIVICPTVREPDGLAMSSRNKYLSPEERRQAPILHKALRATRQAYLNGEKDGETLRQIMSGTINQAALARIDYVSVADSKTLRELDQLGQGVMFSTAVFFGETRLIDNILVPETD